MKFLIFLLLFVLSCSAQDVDRFYLQHPPVSTPKKSISIHIDQNFSSAERGQLFSAIYEWNIALNNSIKLVVESTDFNMDPVLLKRAPEENFWIFLKIESNHLELINEGKRLGFCDQIGGNFLYLVTDLIIIHELRFVTMHEIGHLLGSDHTSNGLMFPYFKQKTPYCIDISAIQNISLYHKIPLINFNWCIK